MKEVSRCWLFVWESVEGFGPETYGNGHSKLEIYPTVILQLTTIGLLLNLSTGALAVLPAVPSLIASENDIWTGAVKAVEMAPQLKEVRAEDYEPLTDPKNIERFINDYFPDNPVMAEIAKCESTFRQFDSKGEVLKNSKSTAIGVFQIMASLHEGRAKNLGLDIRTLQGQAEFAELLYKEQRTKPWMSSSDCWSGFKESEIAKR